MSQMKFQTKTRTKGGFVQVAKDLHMRSESIPRITALAIMVEAKIRVPFRTGALMDSIVTEKTDFGTMWKVKVHKFYGVYVERGTRHMAAQPFLKPAIENQKRIFKRRYKGIFKASKV